MIRIITPGKTDFRITCDKCGCIFEYNEADIDDCYIKCPTCGKKHYGFGSDYELEKSTAEYSPTELAKPNQPSDYYTVPLRTTPDMPVDPLISQPMDCKECPTYKQICSPTGYVGDLPCQWCGKNPWKLTCDTATYTTSTLESDYALGDSSCGCDSTYGYTQYTEPCSCCSEDKEFYNCTAEGVNYEFASDSLGAYESSSFTIDLPKEEDTNK